MNRRYSIGYLTAEATKIVEAERNESIVLRDFFFCNTVNNNHYITVYHVPAGETPDDRFSLYNLYQLTGDTTTALTDVRVHLAPGDSIWAFADTATKIVLTAYGTSSTAATNPFMDRDG